jgi:uncharacterized membrane protein
MGMMGTTTQATGINDSGQVVGFGNLPGVASDRAFVITGGVLAMIAPLGLASASNFAYAINNSGTVVGTSEIVAGGAREAFYTNSSGTAVALTGGTRNTAGNFQGSTTALAIDTNGDIAGFGDVGGSDHGFFAPDSGGPLIDLGTLGGATTSKALGVNDNSLVVGTSGGHAFLWGESEGMIDLNSLVSAANLAGWVLTEATGINDSNQISGEGYFDGVLHGFVLNPIPGQPLFSLPGTVPTPPAIVLSAVGLAIVGCWSRLRLRRGRSEDPAGV